MKITLGIYMNNKFPAVSPFIDFTISLRGKLAIEKMQIEFSPCVKVSIPRF